MAVQSFFSSVLNSRQQDDTSLLSFTKIAVSLVCLLAARFVYSLYFHPLARYPGPFVARLGFPLLSWVQIQVINGRMVEALDEAHEKYGQYVRIGYNELSTVDPDAVPALYGTSTKWTKSDFYIAFGVPNGPTNIFSSQDPHDHACIRRAEGSAYAMNNLLKMEDVVQQNAVRLIENLSNKGTKPFDLGLRLRYLAADVIGSVAFGGQDGFSLLSKDEDAQEYLTASLAVNHVGALFGSWVHAGHHLRNVMSACLGAPSFVANLLEFADKSVAERMAKTKDLEEVEDEKIDMLQHFIRGKDPRDGGRSLTHLQVVRASCSVLAAGTETTSNTMQALIMFGLLHERVMEKLVAEIDEAFDSGKLSWPPLYAEAIKLDYFQACIKETLRVWPTISTVLPRKAPAEGGSIGNRHFPAGTSIGISAFPYHRRAKQAFGEDCRDFRPERWTEANEEQRRTMDANIMTFGGGTRVCVGRNLSILEMSIALPMLLRKYSIDIVPRSSKGPHEKPRVGLGPAADGQTWNLHSSFLVTPSDFYCTLKERQH